VILLEQHLAFLRAINIGSHNPVKMSALKEIFASQGAEQVFTHLRSGNVVFQCGSRDLSRIVTGVEAKLVDLLGTEVPITTRPLSPTRDWVVSNPFAAAELRGDDNGYVTFLYDDAPRDVPLPFSSERGDVIVFELADREALSISRRVEGKYGFPNAFIERELGVLATSRAWSTVKRLVAKYANPR
jgi:uncharacterized protein (DUF1697 family)